MPTGCTKWWRAEWNFKPRGPSWLPAIIRMTWYLQIINIATSIQGNVNGDLSTPFFYSRTSCCGNSGTPVQLDAEFDVVYPDTLLYPELGEDLERIAACDLPYLPSQDPRWSYSAHCPNPVSSCTWHYHAQLLNRT